jgi:selenocysteine lyase/cysteine desulfurase
VEQRAISGVEIPVDDVRARKPGIDQVNYLNSAGASLMPEHVLEAMAEYQVVGPAVGGLLVASDGMSSSVPTTREPPVNARLPLRNNRFQF